MNKSASDGSAPVDRIRNLNDKLRVHGIGGKIMMTVGVQSLSDTDRARMVEAIRSFSEFDADNDPYGEHDFAQIEIGTISIIFKIDYYDRAERHRSPDPADPAVTSRVMTIMVADEY